MPYIVSPATSEAITVDGDTSGYVTVTSNAAYYPGARAWLSDNGTTPSTEYLITDLVSTNKIGLRLAPGLGVPPNYGRTSVSQWKVANSARIAQEETVIRVELSNVAKLSHV